VIYVVHKPKIEDTTPCAAEDGDIAFAMQSTIRLYLKKGGVTPALFDLLLSA